MMMLMGCTAAGASGYDDAQQAQMIQAMYGMAPYLQAAQAQGAYSRMPLPSEHMVEEQPTYVNAKQYRRIIKRRQARALLEKHKAPAERKNYLHESRHRHAMRRPRGPGGRFLTKPELELTKKFMDEGLEEKDAVLKAVAEVAAANPPRAVPSQGGETEGNGTGGADANGGKAKKRKAESQV